MRLTSRSLLTSLVAPFSTLRTASAESSLRNFTSNPLRGLQQFPLSFYSGSSVGNMSGLAPVICLSHGGGPLPVLGDPAHEAITQSLKTRVPQILKLGTPEQPRAIILVTAHWSTEHLTISSGKEHELFYDYYGFPPESYKLKYGASGSPEVAEMVRLALEKQGIRSKKDATRGWDHGVFIPMMLIHPQASVPIVQLSVLNSEDPATHFAIGQALSSLRAQNIAIVGSGFASLHNLRAMFSGVTKTPNFKALNEKWSENIMDAVVTEDTEERNSKFKGWRSWPGAYEMHPRGGAEHFLPLIVCAGAGNGRAKSYSDEFAGLQMWSYYWDE